MNNIYNNVYNKLIQKLLDDNYILIYSTHNEVKSVVTERFIITLKDKVFKKMTASDSKHYLGCLNKLVDEYSNSYHCFVCQELVDAIFSALTEKIATNLKASKSNVDDRVRITKYQDIFNKVYTNNWSREIPGINSVFKPNSWRYKFKDLNGEPIITSFYEK